MPRLARGISLLDEHLLSLTAPGVQMFDADTGTALATLMWAIDHPYQPTPPAVAFIDSAPISDADKEKIAHGNAERIFHIKS